MLAFFLNGIGLPLNERARRVSSDVGFACLNYGEINKVNLIKE
jgi:hypothetical protein